MIVTIKVERFWDVECKDLKTLNAEILRCWMQRFEDAECRDLKMLKIEIWRCWRQRFEDAENRDWKIVIVTEIKRLCNVRDRDEEIVTLIKVER